MEPNPVPSIEALSLIDISKMDDATLLCHNCGWTADFQNHNRYACTIKCIYVCSNRAAWQLGDDYILKQRPLIGYRGKVDHIGPDVETANYVRENTTIPVPEEARSWKDQHSHFTLMKKMPGESMQAAWPRLTTEEKKTCALEVVEYLVQLRTHMAPTPQTIGGAPVRNTMFAADAEMVMMLEDKETWWTRVEKAFKRFNQPEWCEDFKARYPVHAAPSVLTHGDLNTGNIMVLDGHVSGIIDWEHAGYYPDWWEYSTASLWIEEPEWRHYLLTEMKKRLGCNVDATKFCHAHKAKYRYDDPLQPVVTEIPNRGMQPIPRGFSQEFLVKVDIHLSKIKNGGMYWYRNVFVLLL